MTAEQYPEPTSFIGSTADGPGHGVIVLRGDIDAETVERLDEHVADLLAAATRFLVIDASAVDSYDATLLDLLGRTQNRLGERHGLLEVQGLHPALISADGALPDRSGPAHVGPSRASPAGPGRPGTAPF